MGEMKLYVLQWRKAEPPGAENINEWFPMGVPHCVLQDVQNLKAQYEQRPGAEFRIVSIGALYRLVDE